MTGDVHAGGHYYAITHRLCNYSALAAPPLRARGTRWPIPPREFKGGARSSQKQLAYLAGYHRTYVGMLEQQIGNPSLEIVTALADALGVQVAESFK